MAASKNVVTIAYTGEKQCGKPLTTDNIFNCDINCTVCKEKLFEMIFLNNEVFTHPLLQVLLCKDCFDHVTHRSSDACTWCGINKKNLLGCSKCQASFCEKCINMNFGRNGSVQAKLEIGWKCYICDPQKIRILRAIGDASQKMIQEINGRNSSSNVSEDSDGFQKSFGDSTFTFDKEATEQTKNAVNDSYSDSVKNKNTLNDSSSDYNTSSSATDVNSIEESESTSHNSSSDCNISNYTSNEESVDEGKTNANDSSSHLINTSSSTNEEDIVNERLEYMSLNSSYTTSFTSDEENTNKDKNVATNLSSDSNFKSSSTSHEEISEENENITKDTTLNSTFTFPSTSEEEFAGENESAADHSSLESISESPSTRHEETAAENRDTTNDSPLHSISMSSATNSKEVSEEKWVVVDYSSPDSIENTPSTTHEGSAEESTDATNESSFSAYFFFKRWLGRK